MNVEVSPTPVALSWSPKSAALPVVFCGTTGLFTPPATGVEPLAGAALFLSPWGFEEMCTRKLWRELAERLAGAGIASLRFDYPGTGDALDGGDFSGALAIWEDAVAAAAARLRHLSGASGLILIGHGLGATLAATMAPRLEAVQAVAMMAPVVSGRLYLRELAAWSKMVDDGLGLRKEQRIADRVSVAGLVMPDEIAAQVKDLSIEDIPAAPARRILMVERPMRNKETALSARFEQLGAEAVTLPGENVAQEILAYASTNNYAHVIVGMPTSPRWREIFAGSVSHDLIRAKTDVSVHVISPGNGEETRSPATVSARPKRRIDFGHYLWSSLYVAMALGIGTALSRFLDVRNIALVFLMAVLASAMGGGLWPALFASVLGALVFNFFFLEPRYTLDIGDPESVVAFAFFLGVAVIASNLAGRVQRQAVTARQRAKTTEGLYLFSKKLAGAGTLGDVLWATVYQIASMLQVRVVALLPENGRIAVQAGFPPDDTLDDADIAAAQWAWEHDKPAGRGADTLPGAKRLYLPLKTGRTRVGVIGLDNDKQGPVLTPLEQRLFDSLADQAALAIERIQLVADVDNARLAAEADKLRSALLTSLSHDLKTPLASILGSAGALRDYSTSLTDSGRVELLTTIVEEAERLNRFIANLLDMTRLESGATAVSLTPLFIGDSVGSALRRAEKILALHRVDLAVPPDLPMVRLDPVLFEQVLFNLLDNARKYAPSGSQIALRAWADESHVTLQVVDEGPGIPPDDLTRIFDSFYRVRKKDHVQAGTGLGLSICKGFVEAMGGTIFATNGADRPGAIFTLRFPIGPEPSTLEGRI